MGIYASLLSGKKTFAASDRVAEQIDHYSDLQGDPALPAAFEAADEVQTITADVTAGGGTYTLTITLSNGVTFTTAAIAYDANAATIEAAIDTASPASVPVGDIDVTGGPFSTTDIVLTYEDVVGGQNQPLVVFGNSVTDGMDPVADPAVTRTTTGQPARYVWAALKALGVIADTEAPPQLAMVNATAGPNSLHVKPWFIRELAQEAAVQDGTNDSYAAICSVLPGVDTAPLVRD